MKLTGKAKEDFENWYSNTVFEIKHPLITSLFKSKSSIEKNAFIIEWFDSVGIHINIFNKDFQCWWFYDIKFIPTKISQKELQRSRQEAAEKAIEKANTVYNERFN